MASGRLPNIIVVGVPKAGTGSLFAYLSAHPEICPADEKEVGFLNYYHPDRHSGPVPSLDVYRAHYRDCGDERYALDATPSYCYGGQPIIDAIRDNLDDPRIIIALRDPVARLWSAYTFQRQLGNLLEFSSFDDYLAACEGRLQEGTTLVPGNHMHGLAIGYYADYVPTWLDTFGDNLKVVFTEQLNADAPGVMADMFRWLDLEPSRAEDLDATPRNVTTHPRSARAAGVVYSAKRTLERNITLPASIRGPARRLYQRANRGAPPPSMSERTQRHVEDLYRSSTASTAKMLRAHGYDNLPPWLQSTERP